MTNNEKVRFTFRMPNSLYEMLKNRADVLGISVNAMILQILWNHTENEKDVANQ